VGQLKRLKNVLARLRSRGFRATARYARHRLSESYHERRFGIQTAGQIDYEEAGLDATVSNVYYPSDYRTIYRALRSLDIRPEDHGFIDYGSGMGRVVIVAASLPFKRVIGIELSSKLHGIASENLRRSAHRLRCTDVSLVVGDAMAYEIPSDLSVFFFYSPFKAHILTAVLEKVHESLLRRPRPAFIVFKNTKNLEAVMADHPWMVRRDAFPAVDSGHPVWILEARV
jgi:precorrin-6B methylase 2